MGYESLSIKENGTGWKMQDTHVVLNQTRNRTIWLKGKGKKKMLAGEGTFESWAGTSCSTTDQEQDNNPPP